MRLTDETSETPEISETPEMSETSETPKAERKSRSKTTTLFFEIVQTVLLTLIIFLAVRALVQNFRVEGASMEPTLQSGQYLLIDKVSYARTDLPPLALVLPTEIRERGYLFEGPRRGDIIVFRAPTAGQKEFIKRVVALPGDEVRIVQGEVYVNGQPLDEPYVVRQATYDFPLSGEPVRVGPGQYFVLGDNRPNSSDSHLGWTVPAEDVIGKAWLSYWPPSEWRVVEDWAYANVPSGP